ncbi:MAG: type II secretion system protein GspC [Nitrospirae bacterium CG_4_9_14_3_um_filter_53_35]|nr:MAG: type II secretion system protein GspC [Nitrospirae bacterium CG17_big_fil_post_rev_8_21_14_2_50_50_9]PJA73523.1 MAG: type II secretion system protein GspC [Nitrospirae bacterium CG_4_9_14_3_um_filter_53_35]
MHKKRVFQIILISLFILFAADIALKIINSHLYVEKPHDAANKNVLSLKKETKPFSAYGKITERNLFQGASFAQITGNNADDSLDHPKTDLKLTLKGTVVSNRERSFAIIEDTNLKAQNLYHINDNIGSGVTLSAIFEDRVVINRNGRKELLLMFQEDKQDKKGESRPTALAEPPQRIQRQEIQEAASDLRSLMRDVRIIPHFTSGKRDGFTVTYLREGSRLSELGLQKNDIIKAINGTSSEEFKNIFEIFNKYSDAKTLNLEVERDNQVLTINYTVE